MPKVDFLFDFGSPNAYLSHLVIPGSRSARASSSIRCADPAGRVFKLTNNRSPAETNAGIKNKPAYQQLEPQRFIRQHGITRYKPNPFFPVNTLMIMRGAVAARKLGIFERYVGGSIRHMWAEPKKLTTRRAEGGAGRVPTCRPTACSTGPPAVRGGPLLRRNPENRRPRHLRLADLLRRRDDIYFGKGPPARRGRGDRGGKKLFSWITGIPPAHTERRAGCPWSESTNHTLRP